MAKLFYIVAALALFQCVVAEDTTESIVSASTIIKEHAPTFIGEAIDRAEGFISLLPPAVEIDRIIKKVTSLVEKFASQYGPVQQLINQGIAVGPEIIKQAVSSAVAAFVSSITTQVNTPQYSNLVVKASGIASTVQEGVIQAFDIAEKVDELAKPIITIAV